MIFHRHKIRSYEAGLQFRDQEFKGLVGTGAHWFFDPLGKVRVARRPGHHDGRQGDAAAQRGSDVQDQRRSIDRH